MIIWKGYFEGETGYISACKFYPIALMQQGVDVGIVPLSPLSDNNPLKKFVVKPTKDDMVILHQIPTVSPREKGYFTVTEFDTAPHEWWTPLRNSELILTQSDFCREIFSKIDGVSYNDIGVVHFPLDPRISPEGDILLYDKRYKTIFDKPYDFIFGSMFEWVARKKPELMWQAFKEEFPLKEYPNVLFINKLSIPRGNDNWQWYYNKYTNEDPRIKYIIGNIPDIGTFYRSLDCYCSPTAGEGWGATLCEAMACGLPTIGSRHSGNLEFMNDGNSYLVEVGKWEEIGQDPLNKLWMVHPYQRWKLPKIASIRKAMRHAYETKMSGKTNKKAQNALKVRELLSIQNIGKQLHDAIL